MFKSIKNSHLVLLDQAVFSGGSFLSTIVLAKILGAEIFGFYSSIILICYSVVGILNALVINPLQVSLQRIADIKSYISFNLFIQIALVIALAILFLCLQQFNIAFLSRISSIGAILFLYIIGFIMHDYFRKLFLAQSQIICALVIDIATIIFTFFSILYLWFCNDVAIKNVLLLFSLSYMPAIILGVYFIRPNLSKSWLYKDYLKLHVSQGKWLLITTLAQWWASNLFVVASGLYLGVKTLGAFRLVQTLFGVLNILLQTLENYALPKATTIFVSSAALAKSYLKNLSLKTALVFGTALLLLFTFSQQVIVLVGGIEYLPFAYIVKGMCVLYVFIFIGYPVRMAIRMMLLNQVFFVGYLWSLAFSLLSYNFLLHHFNVAGAIVGLIFSQIIVLIYWQYNLHKKQFYLWK